MSEEDQQGDRILRLRQLLYRGEPKVISHPQLEADWIIYVLDDVQDNSAAREWLKKASIIDKTYCNGIVPREIAYLDKMETVLKN